MCTHFHSQRFVLNESMDASPRYISNTVCFMWNKFNKPHWQSCLSTNNILAIDLFKTILSEIVVLNFMPMFIWLYWMDSYETGMDDWIYVECQCNCTFMNCNQRKCTIPIVSNMKDQQHFFFLQHICIAAPLTFWKFILCV